MEPISTWEAQQRLMIMFDELLKLLKEVVEHVDVLEKEIEMIKAAKS